MAAVFLFSPERIAAVLSLCEFCEYADKVKLGLDLSPWRGKISRPSAFKGEEFSSQRSF